MAKHTKYVWPFYNIMHQRVKPAKDYGKSISIEKSFHEVYPSQYVRIDRISARRHKRVWLNNIRRILQKYSDQHKLAF